MSRYPTLFLSNSAHLFCAFGEDAKNEILNAGYFGMKEITEVQARAQVRRFADEHDGQHPHWQRSENFNANVWVKE